MLTPMMNFIHTPYGYCYYHLDKPVSEGGTYLIYGLYVYPNYRRMGHSRRMLQFLIDEIKSTGYTGPIFIRAEPEENSISKNDLIQYYQSMGLEVN
jgi:GNAT superfamily N-acetyltransferase